jgi:hypothetical protein
VSLVTLGMEFAAHPASRVAVSAATAATAIAYCTTRRGPSSSSSSPGRAEANGTALNTPKTVVKVAASHASVKPP